MGSFGPRAREAALWLRFALPYCSAIRGGRTRTCNPGFGGIPLRVLVEVDHPLDGDNALDIRFLHAVESEIASEERREVRPGNFGRRQPESLGADFRRGRPRLGVEETREDAGEEQPPQDRREGCRCDLCAGVRGDSFRNGIGLLSRNSSLLDGEARDVPGREDVRKFVDVSEAVSPDEAGRLVGKPIDVGPFEPRKRDDLVDCELLPGKDPSTPFSKLTGVVCVRRPIPRTSSSSRTASLAWMPNSESGLSSGVTIEISIPGVPRSPRYSAVSSASCRAAGSS